ncbi:MAG: DNA replication initiation complex subunit [Thermoproteus sp.]|nr:DNA replication initiation complex subunit [Thermoproteus sp.]
MLNEIQAWLAAETSSKLLAKPKYGSYAEIAYEVNEALRGAALPPAVEEAVRMQLMKAVASIIELRIKKILWEIYQGREPHGLLAEEERLVAPIKKIAQPPAKTARSYEIVVFLDKFPILSTSDFKRIGPFNKGDMAKIPTEDARNLEAEGVAKRFKLI